MQITPSMHIPDEELERIGAENPDWQIELVDGSIVMSPPANFDAGLRNAKLTSIMLAWGERHGFAVTDSSGGFRLSPDDVWAPDCGLIALERVSAMSDLQRRTFAPHPDIAIELVSEKRKAARAHRKCERWFSFGVGYVVALNPYGEPKVRTWGVAPPEFPTDWSAVVD